MKQLQAAKAEQARREQQKRYDAYLKQATEEEKRKNQNGTTKGAQFKAFSKGFLNKGDKKKKDK